MTIPISAASSELAATLTNLHLERVTSRNVLIRWDRSEDFYHKAYELWRSNDAGTNWYVIATPRVTTVLTDRALPPATYIYKVRDVDKFDLYSDFTADAEITIEDSDPYVATLTLMNGVAQVLDIETMLGRKGTEGSLINNGPGDVTVEFSADGTNYTTDVSTMGVDDVLIIGSTLRHLEISKIRYTSDADTTIFIQNMI